MTREAATELLLIRHAPSLNGGRLCGRTDVAADCSDTARIAALRALLGVVDHVVASPALRCQQTARALWPDLPCPDSIADFWEQDFGQWEGQKFAELPDLGPLSTGALAAHCPPGGETFEQLCWRVVPALGRVAKHGGRVAVVAHAGVVRAGLAMAMGVIAPALCFEIAPLSLTTLRAVPGGGWALTAVNRTPP